MTAKMPIQALAAQSLDFYSISWFLSADTRQHILNIKNRVEQDQQSITLPYWLRVAKIAETDNCLSELISLGVSLFVESGSFDTANLRFDSYVEPYLGKFESGQCLSLLAGAEQNDQIHSRWRNRAPQDIRKILETSQRVLGEEYDPRSYPNLQRFAERVE